MKNSYRILKVRDTKFIVQKRFMIFWWRTRQYLECPAWVNRWQDCYYVDFKFESYEEAYKYIENE